MDLRFWKFVPLALVLCGIALCALVILGCKGDVVVDSYAQMMEARRQVRMRDEDFRRARQEHKDDCANANVTPEERSGSLARALDVMSKYNEKVEEYNNKAARMLTEEVRRKAQGYGEELLASYKRRENADIPPCNPPN